MSAKIKAEAEKVSFGGMKMNLKSISQLAAALLLGSSIAVMAQSSAPSAPTAAARGAPGAPGRAPRAPSDEFRPLARHLIYITLPGTLTRPGFLNGIGIVVLDANDNWRFVKRIPTWEYAGSMSPESVSGVAASPVTNLIYVAARGRLGAFDLATDKLVWSVTLDGKCCERDQVTPDGKIVVVGGDLQDFWYEVDARTGKLIGKIDAPKSPNSHNLVLSPDGKLAFMSPNGKVMSIADIKSLKTVETITFGDNVRPFVLNHDASLIYANTNSLLGYEIADVKTGKVIKHIEVTSVDWKSKWNMTPRPPIPHGCPSHGIALTPDEKEVWVVDGMFNKIHIFSNTDDPKEIYTIDTTDGPFWITFGLDGKYAYVSSGDIIDVKTHKIVGSMKDEYGHTMYSEKLLDMTFNNGHLQRVSNQFANSFGDYQTAEGLGVGPHVTPMPGASPVTLTGANAANQ